MVTALLLTAAGFGAYLSYMYYRAGPPGGWGDANGGGKFGPALHATGYDGVFVRGISAKPVYLYLDGEHAELRERALQLRQLIEAARPRAPGSPS